MDSGRQPVPTPAEPQPVYDPGRVIYFWPSTNRFDLSMTLQDGGARYLCAKGTNLETGRPLTISFPYEGKNPDEIFRRAETPLLFKAKGEIKTFRDERVDNGKAADTVACSPDFSRSETEFFYGRLKTDTKVTGNAYRLVADNGESVELPINPKHSFPRCEDGDLLATQIVDINGKKIFWNPIDSDNRRQHPSVFIQPEDLLVTATSMRKAGNELMALHGKIAAGPLAGTSVTFTLDAKASGAIKALFVAYRKAIAGRMAAAGGASQMSQKQRRSMEADAMPMVEIDFPPGFVIQAHKVMRNNPTRSQQADKIANLATHTAHGFHAAPADGP